jgi:hypothetical protein
VAWGERSKAILAMEFDETEIDQASWNAGYTTGAGGLEPAAPHEFEGLDRFSYWVGYIEGRAARRIAEKPFQS